MTEFMIAYRAWPPAYQFGFAAVTMISVLGVGLIGLWWLFSFAQDVLITCRVVFRGWPSVKSTEPPANWTDCLPSLPGASDG